MSNYGYPPFDYAAPDPSTTTRSAPPQEHDFQTGEFELTMTQPPWLEAGTAARFYITFEHTKDGSIQPTGTAVSILDGNGASWTATGAASITPGTVTQDPSGSNKYYSSIQFGSGVPPGDYIAQWTGSYTPIGTSTALKITGRWAFKVQVTKAPSRYYFWDTAKTT